jgi:hypothetical protein
VRVGGTTLLVVTLVLHGAGSAAAQSGGVVIDPDSPTAKQYKLPVESARQQADPKGDGKLVPPGARVAGTSAAPLFGEGITPASDGTRSRSGAQRPAKANAVKPSSSSADTSNEEPNQSPLKAAIQNPGAPAGGIGAPLLIAGGAALVLLLGTLVGLLLRRRRTG